MRLAIIGARTVPARWGGYDTVASELAPRLVARGHDVTVYCQPRYALSHRPQSYQGVNLRYLPAVSIRALEAISHESACTLDALLKDFDAIYVLGLRASLVHVLHRLRKRPVLMNTDGFDRKRRKWGRLAQIYLQASEALAARVVATNLICDSRALQPYFADVYGRTSTFIPYGAPVDPSADHQVLERYGLTPRGYYLVVARIEPENNVDIALREHAASGTSKKLVVVGTVNYRSRYLHSLRAAAHDGVEFLGGVYEQEHLNALYANCFAYIHGHEVGGTNPSLLRAMGLGCLTLSVDVSYNREVAGDAGLLFSRESGSLSKLIRMLESSSDKLDALRQSARERIRAEYDWEKVADKYDDLLRSLPRTSRSSQRL